LLEARNCDKLGQGRVHLELADDVLVVGADNERGLDGQFSILDYHQFGKMRIGVLLVENDIPVVVLYDEGELLTGGVFEIHFEGDILIGGTHELYGHLVFDRSPGAVPGTLATAIGEANKGTGGDNDHCCGSYGQYPGYTVDFVCEFGFHIVSSFF
jgi:hypothetical protein